MSSSQSICGSSGTTRRGRAANKIITLAGLGGKTSASPNVSATTFPTFRFSPENEELHEILSSSVTSLPNDSGLGSSGLEAALSVGNVDDVQQQSESLPSSPRPGETSPIKEYIRKTWTNKWDKKSLSLDLDFRGKIKTAIEDKRKSIVSHFIPEETGLIPPAPIPSVIPEHTGVTISSDVEVTNTTAITTRADTNRVFSFDSSTQKVSSNITQNTITSLPAAKCIKELDELEVGIDFMASLEYENTMENLLVTDGVDMSNLNWVYPSTACVDRFEGVLKSIESDGSLESLDNDEFIPFTAWVKTMGVDLLEHFLTKFVICLFGAAIFLPLNSFLTAFITFICGILCATVVSQTLSSKSTKTSQHAKSDHLSLPKEGITKNSRPESPSLSNGNNEASTLDTGLLTLNLSPKSQGWMLLFDGHYNPHFTTFHHSDPVFVRLDSSHLYISTPSPKYRISRRKLWNDSQFIHDIKFVRHTVYNISGTQIFIAPDKLASRRVWNKKYPIGIRFPSPSFSWHVTQVSDASATSTLPTPAEVKPNVSSSEIEPLRISKDAEILTTSSTLQSPSCKQRLSMNLVKGDKELSRKEAGGKLFYLFARTCREKEDWFRRLIAASKVNQTGKCDSTDLQNDYLRFMRNIIPNFESCLREGSDGVGKKDKLQTSASVESDESGGAETSSRNTPMEELLDIEKILTVPLSPMFLNALLGRLLYDAVRSPFWSLQLQNTIQRKLNFVKRPPFVDLLIVKDLDLGGSFPIFQRASSPIIDSRGLWIDLDMTYEGNFCLTLETKINLLKLRKSPTNDEEVQQPIGGAQNEDFGEEDDNCGGRSENLVGNLYDSEAEDSGESSEEEIDVEAFYLKQEVKADSETSQQNGNNTASSQPSKGAKFLRMVEKVATSNFVSEIKVVKNAIGKVANTPLLLTVEVLQFNGTLSINIPSPPTNRVWIGFRTKPQMKLVTTPRVGERSVNLNPLTDWIQRKIHQQIQRVLVLPNMDDITIKLMEFKLPA